MNPIWFVRAMRWVRNPPSAGRVKLVLGVVALCFLIWGAEQLFGFPDWLTPNNMRGSGRHLTK